LYYIFVLYILLIVSKKKSIVPQKID